VKLDGSAVDVFAFAAKLRPAASLLQCSCGFWLVSGCSLGRARFCRIHNIQQHRRQTHFHSTTPTSCASETPLPPPAKTRPPLCSPDPPSHLRVAAGLPISFVEPARRKRHPSPVTYSNNTANHHLYPRTPHDTAFMTAPPVLSILQFEYALVGGEVAC
jgi:hypothetical protein